VKTIRVPETVKAPSVCARCGASIRCSKCGDGEDSNDLPFFVWLRTAVNAYAPLGKGVENLLLAAEIGRKLKAAQDGEFKEFKLENDEFDKVYKAVNTFDWNTGVGIACESYVLEMKRANTAKPTQEIGEKKGE
jgi:hypothetical protein